ncbi:DNA-directed DNA polymerase [Melia azedarach]|uniref:DNA-directed DNA polymerase n=1 Tax=Melia azedarach TaxID=155640 RepID=A0ACC1X178_MELAZ|nr:DNA-directed DNA polymerase [Melia azedarach]
MRRIGAEFLTKFFPPSKSSQLRGEIAQFRQLDFEPLYESWERFKHLIRKFPQYKYQDWFQIQLFYNGLNGQTRIIVDTVAGGTLLSKMAEEAHASLEEMACNNYQWPSERSIAKRVVGVHEVDQMEALSAQVATLSNQIKNFTTRKASSSQGKEHLLWKQGTGSAKIKLNLIALRRIAQNISATMKSLETQIALLANSIKGQSFEKFPSDMEPNHKDQCKAITLRSGKELKPRKTKENEAREDKTKKSEVSSKEVEDETPTEVSTPHGILCIIQKKN